MIVSSVGVAKLIHLQDFWGEVLVHIHQNVLDGMRIWSRCLSLTEVMMRALARVITCPKQTPSAPAIQKCPTSFQPKAQS